MKIRSFISSLLMIISVIFGAVSVGTGYGEPIVPTIMTYLITGILPLVLAIFLVVGMKGFKITASNVKGLLVHPGVRVYVLITIITPLLLGSLDTMKFSNMDRLSSPSDVYFSNISVEWLGYTLVFAGISAFMAFAGVFVLGWKNSKKSLRYTFIVTISLSIIISVIIYNDYKAINLDGLVISTLGDKEEITWSDVIQVNLIGNISSDGFTKTSTNSFKWKFEFLLKNGETEEFGPFTYSKSNLKYSLNIKKVLAKNNIFLSTDQLFEEEWEYVQIDMDYETEASPEDFYSIFQYNPKTKEYYDIHYSNK